MFVIKTVFDCFPFLLTNKINKQIIKEYGERKKKSFSYKHKKADWVCFINNSDDVIDYVLSHGIKTVIAAVRQIKNIIDKYNRKINKQINKTPVIGVKLQIYSDRIKIIILHHSLSNICWRLIQIFHAGTKKEKKVAYG